MKKETLFEMAPQADIIDNTYVCHPTEGALRVQEPRHDIPSILGQGGLFHCMPAVRHSDSTPDSRHVSPCSRLPCGSYGAGSPTAVVCSRELVSCGDGGTLRVCCS